MTAGSVEFNQNGSSTATGIEDAAQAAVGASGTATATTPSDNWVADTVALKGAPGDTSITVTRPANRAAGDFLLVAVTAQDLGAGNICAPNDGTWTLVQQDRQPVSGSSVTHAVFRSFRSGAGAETYQFDFQSGACPSGGSPVSVGASAVAVRYTGVDTTNPIDLSASGIAPTNPGTTLTAPAVTTNFANDQVVRFYGTGSTSITAGSVTYNQSGAYDRDRCRGRPPGGDRLDRHRDRDQRHERQLGRRHRSRSGTVAARSRLLGRRLGWMAIFCWWR